MLTDKEQIELLEEYIDRLKQGLYYLLRFPNRRCQFCKYRDVECSDRCKPELAEDQLRKFFE